MEIRRTRGCRQFWDRPLTSTGLASSGDYADLILWFSSDPTLNEDNAPFYQVLSRVALGAQRRAIALVPSKNKDIADWIQRESIQVQEILEVDLVPPQIGRETCVILLDDRRVITGLWIGKVVPRDQTVILSRVRGEPVAVQDLARTSAPATISEDELQKLAGIKELRILDIRGRKAFASDHRQHALNIPLDEIAVRAAHELASTEYIVIDCTQVPAVACESAARSLFRAGFYEVSALMPKATIPGPTR